MDAFERCGRSMSAVARTHESDLRYFGTIAGERLKDAPKVVRVTHIKEKPDAGYARRHLRVPGLPRGHYLSWFGQHLFTPGIFDALKYQLDNDLRENGEIQLTSAQELLRQQEGDYFAYETEGRRYDTGIPAEYARTVWEFSQGVVAGTQDGARDVKRKT
jgi:UTP--glucose-1-phosphate uridylyltransferase